MSQEKRGHIAFVMLLQLYLVKNAEEAERNRGYIDFTRQHSEWSGFDMRNAARIAKLRAEGKWPF